MIHSQSSHSGQEILGFIRKHAKVCWQGWPDEEILAELVDDKNEVGIISVEGEISGIAVGRRSEDKVLHLKHIETLRHRDVQLLIHEFIRRFPGWQITATRRGKFVTYNTAKLLRKLYV